jgi:hypothetical protein
LATLVRVALPRLIACNARLPRFKPRSVTGLKSRPQIFFF